MSRECYYLDEHVHQSLDWKLHTKAELPTLSQRTTNKIRTTLKQDIADQTISIVFQTVAVLYPLKHFPFQS
jgi:hypothetical protein